MGTPTLRRWWSSVAAAAIITKQASTAAAVVANDAQREKERGKRPLEPTQRRYTDSGGRGRESVLQRRVVFQLEVYPRVVHARIR